MGQENYRNEELEGFKGELLSAFLDKELNSTELKQVKDLLTSSSRWREELEKLQRARTITRSAPFVKAPLDLVASLQIQAARHIPFHKSHREMRRIWFMASAAAATVVLVIGLWAGRHHRVEGGKNLELNSLYSVHNANQMDLSSHQGIVSAANYSTHLKTKGSGNETF